MAITQKRYDKTYHYPITNSAFLNILYKDKLIEIIQSGKLEFKVVIWVHPCLIFVMNE